LDPKTLTGEQTLEQAKAAAKEHIETRADGAARPGLVLPAEARQVRRRTNVPATKPKNGNRRGRIRKDPFA
jgi:hypothetical protein